MRQLLPFTVLKRSRNTFNFFFNILPVATALTVHGIETHPFYFSPLDKFRRLQQLLPFTVCAEGCEAAEEQSDDEVRTSQVPERREGKIKVMRKYYLPITVLKLFIHAAMDIFTPFGCNSTYRLRYAPKGARQQRSSATMKSAHLKYLNEVRVKQK